MIACNKSSMLLLVVLVSLAASVAAAKSPFEEAFEQAKSQIQALMAPSQQLNIINAPLIIIGQGPAPIIIKGFDNLVNTLTAGIGQGTELKNMQKSDIDQFQRLAENLLNILIGKGNILDKVPIIGQPISAALRRFEAIVDTSFLIIINSPDNQELSDRAKDAIDKLDNIIDLAINTYGSTLVRIMVFNVQCIYKFFLTSHHSLCFL